MGTVSGRTVLTNLIPEIWSGKMYSELRSNLVFGSLFEKSWSGELANLGDKVNVSQVSAVTGEVLTDDTSAFTTEGLTINTFQIECNSRAVASVEITDLAMLQSIKFQEELKASLLYSIAAKLEAAIITALVPSASAPDHQIAPAAASSLAVADLGTMRKLLSVAKVPMNGRFLVLDPAYYSDLLSIGAISSKDYVNTNNAVEGFVPRYMGFDIYESNLLSADLAYACHPSALQLVMQKEPSIKISDMHVNGKFGSVISADLVFGLKLFDDHRIVKMAA